MSLGTWAANTNAVPDLTAEERKVLAAFRKEKSDTKRMTLLDPMTRDRVMDVSAAIRTKLKTPNNETLAQAAKRLGIK